MKKKYAKEVTILRQFIREGLFKENNIEVTSLEEMQKLQYKEHLKQMQPVIYKEHG